MPTLCEARCLNCGNLGHFREECPKIECENCHLHGHTAINCDRCLPAKKIEYTDINKNEDTSTAEEGKDASDDGEFDAFLKLLESPNAENEAVEDDQSTSSNGSLAFLNLLKADTNLPENHLSTDVPKEMPVSDEHASQPGNKEEGELPWRRPWWELQW
jgi:hypothetical protein